MGIGNGLWVDWTNTAFMWAEGVKFFDDKWNVILESPEMKPKMLRYLEQNRQREGVENIVVHPLSWTDS